MTDLLARPANAEPVLRSRPDADDDSRDGADEAAAPGVTVAPVRWFLAALLVGAGAIHLAMAPSHLGESAVEGAGFLAAAWVQLLLAGAVALRPTRRALAAVAATSLALIVAWAVSRTAGLPFGAHRGHAESVTFVDGACVALEAVALLLAAALTTRSGRNLLGTRDGAGGADGGPGGHRTARGLSAMALAGTVGAIALATGAIASPSARDHAAGAHGDHGAGGEMAAGHQHGAGAGGAAADDKGFAALSNGHQHEHVSDEPLSADERVLLAQQLAATSDLVERYPTLGDAEAAGWTRAGPFAPALGTHYSAPRDEGTFTMGEGGTMDPASMPTPMLVYDGLDADAPLAGFMYLAYGVEGEPEGFAGPHDNWHYHEAVCVKYEDGVINTPFGADLEGVTERMCTDIGGQWIDVTSYMVHVWNVPGYESPDGMFTELNRKITCPDGTYHRIDIRNVGNRDTVCRNG